MKNLQDFNRWALADLTEAVDLAKQRLNQGISVQIDPLGEYASSDEQARRAAEEYRRCITLLSEAGLESVSVAVKLSALGLAVHPGHAEAALREIACQARARSIPLEIDIEGSPLVDETCGLAQNLAREGVPLVLALQAYLDRTSSDLERSLNAGLKIRLVKGAYLGDTSDFSVIQQRFLALFDRALASRRPFDVGTHDPDLVRKMTDLLEHGARHLVTFGFLKGLADQTKVDLQKAGWSVAEYVPYGASRGAYERRRQFHLKYLASLGRSPVP